MNYIFYKEQFLGIEKAETEILWRKHPEMNHSKKFFRGFENARSKRYFGHNRNQLHVLTGFLTGHCRLRKKLIRMGLSGTDEFRFCGEEKNLTDLATECIAIASQRNYLASRVKYLT